MLLGAKLENFYNTMAKQTENVWNYENPNHQFLSPETQFSSPKVAHAPAILNLFAGWLAIDRNFDSKNYNASRSFAFPKRRYSHLIIFFFYNRLNLASTTYKFKIIVSTRSRGRWFVSNYAIELDALLQKVSLKFWHEVVCGISILSEPVKCVYLP